MARWPRPAGESNLGRFSTAAGIVGRAQQVPQRGSQRPNRFLLDVMTTGNPETERQSGSPTGKDELRMNARRPQVAEGEGSKGTESGLIEGFVTS